METRLCSQQLFDSILGQIPVCGYDFVSVFIAVTLPPVGQTLKQQSEHFKQQIVSHSQELRVEGQGNGTRVVRVL